MNILIGGAWVYANGSTHIGHIAALLPGDVIARYHRLRGDRVCYVSGSDCHGTPVTLRAKREGKRYEEISDKFHLEFIEDFNYLGFSYDIYGKTTSQEHKDFVKRFHKKLYESDYIYEKSSPQAYCEECSKFLPDRFVVGICPQCGKDAKGDQCDHCGNVYQPEELLEIRCTLCGSKPILRESEHLYIAITRLKEELQAILDGAVAWRKNGISLTQRYIDEGLRDRAITRDIDWGIEVPKEGYEDKKIYIWAENVLGYLSTCEEYCKNHEIGFEEFFNNDARHYYVHGKDNIPFHSIILPSLLKAHGCDYHLPDRIVSSEYLTLDGKKISTSEDYAVWTKDLIGKYNPDAIRYFLLAHGPEKRDADFTWREFINSNNGELLGAYGNFINRTLVFIGKSFGGNVPKGTIQEDIRFKIENLYKTTGEAIEKGELKKGLLDIFHFIREANKFFDAERPWITAKEDRDKCEDTLYNCVQIIANLSILLEPYLPFSSKKVISWLGINKSWEYVEIEEGKRIPEIEILFERLEKNGKI